MHKNAILHRRMQHPDKKQKKTLACTQGKMPQKLLA